MAKRKTDAEELDEEEVSTRRRRGRGESRIDEVALKELEDVARGFEGSQGDVSLSPSHADTFEQLGGDISETVDTGNGGCLVNAETLCDLVLGPREESSEEGVRGSPRRRLGHVPARRGDPKVRSNIEKESNSTGRIISRGGKKSPTVPGPSGPESSSPDESEQSENE